MTPPHIWESIIGHSAILFTRQKIPSAFTGEPARLQNSISGIFATKETPDPRGYRAFLLGCTTVTVTPPSAVTPMTAIGHSARPSSLAARGVSPRYLIRDDPTPPPRQVLRC